MAMDTDDCLRCPSATTVASLFFWAWPSPCTVSTASTAMFCQRWSRPWRQVPRSNRGTHLARLAGMLVVLGGLTASCSSGGSDALPGSLFGTWNGGNNVVHSVRFSNGGRLEINGPACNGYYQLSAIDRTVGTVNSGYLNCGSIMDGDLAATVTVTGNSMTVTGAVINGTYQRG
jgi:hypothetical protein